MEGKNNKVLLNNFKLLRIIPKIKKIIHFFQKWGEGAKFPSDLVMVR